ncbi:50S ribosomal protein L20 [Candidatus Roizmanbacteria bacterium RIFCSPHIGHO2_12_FULL_33_9]|uniref:Large ribosomal subunit protein bL20 n=1 Tax=Candidatus Roizmanbacteria bacterium RIFCSPHIGHO2_12_FULL_33_9 TaxID=1802045 RepID=A0A1F7HIR3_9BACT|nr:MAG: 50S ribosomal protein L20 [Candidatus Roizmanbacteria bacterium RIFCSPHIGHO2_12_FULL_33_9]
MVRVKTGTVRKRKHNKILKKAKGYWMSRHKQYKKAHEAVLHAGQYAFAGRKLKKRDFRSLWIIRINAALRKKGLTYSKFVNLLKKQKIELDRKILAQIAFEYPTVFDEIIDKVHSSSKTK